MRLELRWVVVLLVVLSLAYAGRKKDRSLKVRHRENRDQPDDGVCELEIHCKVRVAPGDDGATRHRSAAKNWYPSEPHTRRPMQNSGSFS